MNPEQRRRLKQQIAQKAEAGHRPGGTVLPQPADVYPPPPRCPCCGMECVVWNGKSRCCGSPMTPPAAPSTCAEQADQRELETANAEANRPKKQPKENKSRLPAGSTYAKLWDGSRWKVTLTVDGQAFVAYGSGSMKTEFKADELYRRWLADQKKPA